MYDKHNSVSRIGIILEAVGVEVFRCEFARHLAPLTVANLLRALPVSGRLYKLNSSIRYLETGLNVGAEKQKTIFGKGDLGYLTSNGALCVVLKAGTRISMNPIGRFLGDLNCLSTLPSGQVVNIKRLAPEN